VQTARLARCWPQQSVREWAIRQGWGGRPVRREQAQGILVAALGMKDAYAVLDDGLRIEEQRSAVAKATAVRDPRRTLAIRTRLAGGHR
jgi:hypothetical protein